MVDLGLLSGLASGLREGIGSYKEERSYQDAKAEKEREKALRQAQIEFDRENARKQMAISLMDKGLEEGPQGLSKSDDLKRKEAFGEAEKQAGLLRSGYKADYNPETGRFDLNKVSGRGDLDEALKISQLEKNRADIARAEFEKTPKGRLEKSPGEVRQKIGFVTSALSNLTDYTKAFNDGGRQGYLTPQTPILGALKSSTPIDEARLNLEEAIGRMASGGAINTNEEKRFRDMIPTAADSDKDAARKMASLRQEMGNKLTGYGFGTSDLPEMGFDSKRLGLEGPQGLIAKSPKKSMSGKGLVVEAKAGGEADDSAAMNWLKANPNHPDAEGVRQSLKMRGF